MTEDDLRNARAWKTRTAVLLGVLGLVLLITNQRRPDPLPLPRPLAPPQPQLRAEKECNPACTGAEVCVDGTCSLPAPNRTAPAVGPAGRHGLLLTRSPWVAGSLR